LNRAKKRKRESETEGKSNMEYKENMFALACAVKEFLIKKPQDQLRFVSGGEFINPQTTAS
jgi:hypothetical protein